MEIDVKKIPRSGSLLLAEPFLADEHFKRSVILLCEHKNEGSLGFIVNKPLGIDLNDAIEDFPSFEAELHYGGPVQTDTLHYIHTLGDRIEGSVKIGKGLYWGGNFEVVRLLIEQGEVEPSDFKFFLGYAGWGAQQLEEEMKEKSWIVAKGDPAQLLHKEPGNLWREVLKSLGGQYIIMSNFPEHPSLN